MVWQNHNIVKVNDGQCIDLSYFGAINLDHQHAMGNLFMQVLAQTIAAIILDINRLLNIIPMHHLLIGYNCAVIRFT
jgi:hypothetical protein